MTARRGPTLLFQLAGCGSSNDWNDLPSDTNQGTECKKKQDKVALPERPVERIIGIVRGLWDQDDVQVSPRTLFEMNRVLRDKVVELCSSGNMLKITARFKNTETHCECG
jgi:hypothetical protein